MASIASLTQTIIGLPQTSCNTFGVFDFIRVPSPAASTMTVSDRLDSSSEADCMDWEINRSFGLKTLFAPYVGGQKKERAPRSSSALLWLSLIHISEPTRPY